MTGQVILVPVDAARNADRALQVAKHLSDLLNVAVRSLHTSEQVGPLAETAEAILQAASDGQARLIVMNAYAEDVRPPDAIGAVALAVLLGAACPVVLVEPTQSLEEWTLRRVLVAHDGSPAVGGALRPAAELAGLADAELVVLQAAGVESAAERGSIAPPLYVDQTQHEWPAWSGEFLHRLASVSPLEDVRVRLRIGRGEPGQETIQAANEESADLIVLPWRGHWEAQRAPTLKAVLRAAPCPTMVTRIPTP